MRPEDRYHRFVHWSDEDQCYIGYCPDLYTGGVCHAEDELEACRELCTISREEVAHRLAAGRTPPLIARCPQTRAATPRAGLLLLKCFASPNLTHQPSAARFFRRARINRLRCFDNVRPS